ncbi:hypothetical protein V1477_015322, partial [Vespula maculifrons]
MRDFDFASTPMRAKQKDLCKKNNSVKARANFTCANTPPVKSSIEQRSFIFESIVFPVAEANDYKNTSGLNEALLNPNAFRIRYECRIRASSPIRRRYPPKKDCGGAKQEVGEPSGSSFVLKEDKAARILGLSRRNLFQRYCEYARKGRRYGCSCVRTSARPRKASREGNLTYSGWYSVYATNLYGMTNYTSARGRSRSLRPSRGGKHPIKARASATDVVAAISSERRRYDPTTLGREKKKGRDRERERTLKKQNHKGSF